MTISANKLPLNVYVARRSSAEKAFRERAGLAIPLVRPEAIVDGIAPSPEHDLQFHGGKTITDLTFKNLYVGGAEAWNASDIQSIDSALAATMSDDGLNNVMAQYFPGANITSVAAPSEILVDPAPSVVSQGDAENMIRNLHVAGQLDAFDLASTVFNLLLPSGTVLNTDPGPAGQLGALEAEPGVSPVIPHDEDDSLNGLGGYHGSVHIQKAGSADTVYYAVGVYSEQFADGTINGIAVFDEPWKNVVATFYHELNEARTDADVGDAIRAGSDPNAVNFLGWTSPQGEECGDYPVSEADPLTLVFQEIALTNGQGTVPVQFQYSNAVHGPEGPIAAPH